MELIMEFGFLNDGDVQDIRRDYYDLLSIGKSNEEAERIILEEVYYDMIGTPYEYYLWIGLAYYEWKAGRLSLKVKVKAVQWIEDLLSGVKSSDGIYGKQGEFEKYKNLLMSEQPKPRKFSKPPVYNSIWPVGSIIAIKIEKDKKHDVILRDILKHSHEKDREWIRQNDEIFQKYLGKYIILRIVDIKRWNYIRFIKDDYFQEDLVLALYAWVGDTPPNAEIVKETKFIFPLSPGEFGYDVIELSLDRDCINKITLLSVDKNPYYLNYNKSSGVNFATLCERCCVALFNNDILP
jgi:hypothetical protein